MKFEDEGNGVVGFDGREDVDERMNEVLPWMV